MTYGGKDLDQVQRTEVVDVLNWIVEEQRVPERPRSNQVNRKQKRRFRRSALATAEAGLSIEPVTNL